MPVVTLVKPMRYHHWAGGITQYGVGQYWFEGRDAYNWYVMLHSRDGRPENDDVRITDPGPPIVDVSSHPWMPS
jgi:hypothetical protein